MKITVFCILVILISGGVGSGFQYSDTITPVDITQSEQREISSRVIAKAAEWRNSGVLVKEGIIYHIAANGRWNVGQGWAYAGPDGIGCTHLFQALAPPPLLDGYSWCTLIAKVGEDGRPFAVGSELEFKATKTGLLYFAINDGPQFVGDNDGYVDVIVSLSKKNKNINLENEISVTNNQNIDQTKRNAKPSSNKGTNWAVIVGLSEYQYSGTNGLSNLIFADDDAKSFAKALAKLGWSSSHIKLLINENATQRNILIALESWLSKAGPDDMIVLFWAGHGFPDPEDPEKVYLACYDTDIGIPATGYRMDKVRDALEEKNSKNVIIFADTCHAGKLITRSDGKRGISIVSNIRNQNVPKGWVFMVGADTDRQSIEHSSWKNGAFTYSLLKGLSGEADGFQSSGVDDGIVTMGELKAYMNTAMPDETLRVLGVAKRPVITTSTGDPEIWNLTLKVDE